MSRIRDTAQGPRFSWHFLRYVEECAIGGMTTNAEIAQILRRYDDAVTASHVSKWRIQHPKFDRACKDALAEANAAVAGVVFRAAMDGDVAAGRWWLERRSPAFMPKSKTEHTGTEGLDDVLRRRKLTDDELRVSGVLLDPDEPEPDEDEDD